MADHYEEIERLAIAVLDAHQILCAALADLPIPVIVPEMPEELASPNDMGEVLMALDRAGTLVGDMPLPTSAQAAYRHMILDWLGAYEMVALVKTFGPAPWRMDVAGYALYRFAAMLHMIEQGEFED